MVYYPIFVELADRKCVVIGGGPVAGRKVDGLLAAGAVVHVVSPTLTPALTSLVATGRITHERRDYRPGDLAGAALAFTAIDDPHMSAIVALEARRLGVWLNAADDPARCSFILPAVLRRGVLTVGVASGGATPALTRLLRDHLETTLGSEWAALADMAAEARRELRAAGRTADGERWQRALGEDVRALLAGGRRDEARRLLRERLEAPA
jgi:precorrin-2 dehydrogenase/sirohydrochlorin ferrochelatase